MASDWKPRTIAFESLLQRGSTQQTYLLQQEWNLLRGITAHNRQSEEQQRKKIKEKGKEKVGNMHTRQPNTCVQGSGSLKKKFS